MEVQELKKVNIGFGIIDGSSLQLDSLMLPARSCMYACLVFLDSDYIGWQSEIFASGSIFWVAVKKNTTP